MQDSYEIQVGDVDSGKFKGTVVTFRRMSAGQRAEVIDTYRGNATANKDGEVKNIPSPIFGQMKHIIYSIKEPKDIKNENELKNLDPDDFDNLLALAFEWNPLASKPISSEK